MTKKIILLALAAISAAMFALPAVASAGEWSLDPAGGKFPVSFNLSSSTTTTLTTDDGSGLKVTCSTATGSGKQVTSTTSEEVTLTFSGCKENLFGSSCTSTGQTSGTIKTTDLVGHNVILEKGPPEVRGVLLTPNAGHFATFDCLGFFHIVVGGNGIIGEMTAPTTCGAVANTATVKYESPTTGTQKWTQVTTTGTKFNLTSSVNSGAAATASQDGTGTVNYAENMTFTC
jgi:hypothetical protein